MHGVDYIFHAAALKQVPSCEFFPMEAVRTNIQGTDNVLHAAITEGVKRVVCLSTDKAAYPINAMGISKAMMEHVIFANARNAAERGGTVICCTRYGNVMCSRGSVIPLFIDQIHAGNPITITDPNMTRFLMNLDEAVELVKFAFEHAKPGDLFIALNYLLIRCYHIYGAVLATTIAHGIQFALHYCAAKKIKKSYFPYKIYYFIPPIIIVIFCIILFYLNINWVIRWVIALAIGLFEIRRIYIRKSIY